MDRLRPELAIFALIRQILTGAAPAPVAKGLVRACDVAPVIGAPLTIGLAVWSVADQRGRRQEAAAAGEKKGGFTSGFAAKAGRRCP